MSAGEEDNQAAADSVEQQLQNKLSLGGLGTSKPLSFNMNASAFVPNFGAPEFVPTFLSEPSSAPADPVPAITAAPALAVKKGTDISAPAPKKPAAAPAKSSTPVKVSAQSLASTSASSSAAESQAEEPEITAEDLAAEEEFYEDAKEHFNVVFIGHVDAGKSTMGGNILYLTGMVDKRTLEKYEKEAKEQGRESWYLSWALDLNAEERAKGKTVECGRASFETEKRRFTILDAPGHKSYVPNMISGASQADIAVLVISARKGEFETGFERGGQTREHAMLAKTAGVKRLVVVINKMDDPTVNWDKERYDECCSKLLPFLKQCGYNPKTEMDFMPVSGFTGANLKECLTKDTCSWYSGPSLLEFLDTVGGIDRKSDAPFMMPISEKYRDMGTIVAGKIESGRVRKGKQLVIMPNKTGVEVLAVYGEQDDELKSAQCGDNIRLRLKGVEEEDVHRGFVLCDQLKPVHTVQAFEAQLMILEHKNIICAGYAAVMHVHTVVEEINIAALLHLIDKKTGRRSKKPPMFVKKGQVVVVRIETTGPICLETYESYQQLGRFTLRDEGKTVAMGKVTKLIDPN